MAAGGPDKELLRTETAGVQIPTGVIKVHHDEPAVIGATNTAFRIQTGSGVGGIGPVELVFQKIEHRKARCFQLRHTRERVPTCESVPKPGLLQGHS